MNRTFNILAQVGLIVAQFAAAAFIKNKNSQRLANAGIAAAQGAIAVIAHSYNPDGTSATTPYFVNDKSIPLERTKEASVGKF